MTQIRLIINYAEISPGEIIDLSKEDKRYLFNVLRCATGEKILILDGKGKSFHSKLIDKNHIAILEENEQLKEDKLNLILCQALLKGEKMDFIIQKATEIGVKKIIPFISERCIPKKTNKIERWRRIAKESSEQSGRLTIPEINSIEKFEDLIETVNNGILFWEKARSSLLDVFVNLNLSEPIFLIIGPEGGFSSEEVNRALKRQIEIASLGNRILRADTAAIVSLSLVSFLCENYVIIKQNEHDIKGKGFRNS